MAGYTYIYMAFSGFSNGFFPFIFISWRLITLQYCSRYLMAFKKNIFIYLTVPGPSCDMSDLVP